jgi:hypothetical protein
MNKNSSSKADVMTITAVIIENTSNLIDGSVVLPLKYVIME